MNGVRPGLAPGWSSRWGKREEISAGCVLKVNPRELAVFDHQRSGWVRGKTRAQDCAKIFTVGARKVA